MSKLVVAEIEDAAGGNPYSIIISAEQATTSDTSIDFQPDQIQMIAGGVTLIDAREASQDYVKLGDGTDVDINLNDNVFII